MIAAIVLAVSFVPVLFVVMQRPSEGRCGATATPLPKLSPEQAATAEPKAALAH
jgi:hypothetical protein